MNILRTPGADHAQKTDFYEANLSRLVDILLLQPRLMRFTRTTLRFLRSVTGVCIAFVILANVQSFAIATLRVLYTITIIPLVLHVVCNICYIVLLWYHYPRLRVHLRRRASRARIVATRLLIILITLLLMTVILIFGVVSIP